MWNKRNDEPTTFRPQGEPMRSPAPTPIAPGTGGACGDNERTKAVGSDRPFDDDQGRDSRTGGTAGGWRGGGTAGIAEPADGGTEREGAGNIKARQVAIFGSVRGNVEVTEKIAIREQGSLIGDIKAAGISIDDGAYFKGSIDIVRPEPKVTTKAVQSEPRMEAHAS